jgi:hypothetical protein
VVLTDRCASRPTLAGRALRLALTPTPPVWPETPPKGSLGSAPRRVPKVAPRGARRQHCYPQIAVAQLSPVRRVINTTEPTEQHKRREDPPEFTRHSRFERLDDRLKCAMGEHLKHPYSWTASATFSARA